MTARQVVARGRRRTGRHAERTGGEVIEWTKVRLGDVVALEYGKALPARDRDPNGKFRVAGSNGPDGMHSTALVSGPGIVVGRKGSAGKVHWYDSDFWPIDTTYYAAPKVPLDMRWAYYLLSHLSLGRLATTTGVPGLNRKDAYRIAVLLPPLSEQRRIVDILDQADRLRRLRAEADAKADRILPALFIEMFGDPVTAWDVARLGDLLREEKGALQSGPFGTHLHNHDFVPSGSVLAVGIDNVQDGEFVLGRNRRITAEKHEELKKYTLEQGDVLITIMGTVGRTCVFPGTQSPAICTKHVYRIQLDDRVHPEYVSAVLRFSQPARAQLGASATGQIVAGIKSDDLRRLPVSVPPRDLQDEFAIRKRHIGENNSGKSNILRALDLALGETWPTERRFSEQDFHNQDTSNDIVIRVLFDQTVEEWRNGAKLEIAGVSLRCKAYKRRVKSKPAGTLSVDYLSIDKNGNELKAPAEPPEKGKQFKGRWLPVRVTSDLVVA